MAVNHMTELSPRQRMINMMYLVLTALLAMNISKEVLEAFQKMDNSIAYSYSDKLKFNDKQYADFELKASNNPEKLSQWNDVAQNLKSSSSNFVSLLDSIRFKIKEETGVDEDGKIINLDDKEITMRVLVKTKEEKGYGLGQDLKLAREIYRDYLISLECLGIYAGQDSIYKQNITLLFNTPDYLPDIDK